MLIELFIFFEIVAIGLFIGSFFAKQEILWMLTMVITSMLMIMSYYVEKVVYIFNGTTQAYMPTTIFFSYPYLMAINMLFFVLALILGLFDLFDKYGNKFTGMKE